MPEWLSILLCVFGNCLVAYLLQRRAYNRGYEAGMSDSLEISRQVDEILRGGPGG